MNDNRKQARPSPVLLSSEAHKATKVAQREDFADFSDENLLSITIDEFAHAASSFPLVFIKNGNTGEFHSCALTGFEAGNNVYCATDNTQWEGIYVPKVIRRVPFSLGLDPNADKSLTVYVDENSSALSTEHGQALFDEQGEETAFLKSVKQELVHFYNAELASQAFIKTLLDNKLLKEIEVIMQFDSSRSKRIKGLYTIEEEQLAALDESTIASFFKQQYFAPIYTMLASITQLNRMLRLHNQCMPEKITSLNMRVASKDDL
ncbi:SapC family protein [Ningiella sp. W23]|uniref:SapC family protein n=1 Tax=Ningiella sp. W23 TaxID=3023715 RepID=UPI003757F64D